MPELLTVAIVGAIATILTYAIGVLASRKFGLPGLARSVETEQAALIVAQKQRMDLLEDRIGDLELCTPALATAERRLTELHRQMASDRAELLRLYRLTGQKPRDTSDDY